MTWPEAFFYSVIAISIAMTAVVKILKGVDE